MGADPGLVPILMADDDPDDCELAREALTESRLRNPLYIVGDGQELLDYLRHEGRYAAPGAAPTPGVILADLNMPRLSGREAIAAIKQDQALRHVPIIVLTTSHAEEDVYRSYELGVSSYIVKPVTFASLVEVMQELGRYWFEIVSLPPEAAPG